MIDQLKAIAEQQGARHEHLAGFAMRQRALKRAAFLDQFAAPG